MPNKNFKEPLSEPKVRLHNQPCGAVNDLVATDRHQYSPLLARALRTSQPSAHPVTSPHSPPSARRTTGRRQGSVPGAAAHRAPRTSSRSRLRCSCPRRRPAGSCTPRPCSWPPRGGRAERRTACPSDQRRHSMSVDSLDVLEQALERWCPCCTSTRWLRCLTLDDPRTVADIRSLSVLYIRLSSRSIVACGSRQWRSRWRYDAGSGG